MAGRGTIWLCVFLLLQVLGQSNARSSAGLADDFYSEIRDLLNQQLALQEDGGESPRPREIVGWPQPIPGLGQVSGVSVRPDGQPVIFHRGPRVWDTGSFNKTEHFQGVEDGPIAVDTVLTLDSVTGAVIDSWGGGFFYLPHGVTVDHHGNTWLTDVAMHQVFKFPPGASTPELVFGEKFRPGAGTRRLCKPTAVAVASSGEVFIADGYCNSRILKFNGRGHLLRILPQPPEFLSLQVPHGLALLEHLDVLCVADRENMRVTCPGAGLRGQQGEQGPALTIQEPDLGRVFGVAARGSFVYAVNGPTSPQIPVRGFTLLPKSEAIVDHWEPAMGFSNPHSLAICPNGSALYVAEISPNRVWKFELAARHTTN
ncbi:peptidyl-alpha-hydroxyglycine alpha-amidating lyase 2 [Anabrus simplex]|uniref:peptidyl-alpha-hydroxyglycine alpha-amidating lyase 2 n=1 Tax=Anabrus simplex TaxID=316456 RepID=UPI0035A2AF58